MRIGRKNSARVTQAHALKHSLRFSLTSSPSPLAMGVDDFRNLIPCSYNRAECNPRLLINDRNGCAANSLEIALIESEEVHVAETCGASDFGVVLRKQSEQSERDTGLAASRFSHQPNGFTLADVEGHSIHSRA